MVICDESSGPFVYSLEHVSVRYCVGVPNAASIVEDGEHKGVNALFFFVSKNRKTSLLKNVQI